MSLLARAAAVRALRTFAQTLIALIGTTAVLEGIDWRRTVAPPETKRPQIA